MATTSGDASNVVALGVVAGGEEAQFDEEADGGGACHCTASFTAQYSEC